MIPIKTKVVNLKQAFAVSLLNIPNNANTALRIINGGPGLNVLIMNDVSIVDLAFSFTATMDAIWTAGPIVFSFEKYSGGSLVETITKSYTKLELNILTGATLGGAHTFSMKLQKLDSIKILIDTTAATISAGSADISMIINLK